MTRSLSVIIVEQDGDLRKRLMDAFESRGYVTWTCPAPEVATCIAAAVRADIVLLDLDIAGPKALDFLKLWKEMAPDTRVVVESSEIDPETMRRMMEQGADAFVLKPLALSPLFNLLEIGEPPPYHSAPKAA